MQRAGAQTNNSDAAAASRNDGVTRRANACTGDCPLLWASFKGLTDVVAALLAGGADVNAVCALGNRALHLAASAGRDDAAALLLLHGADAAARNAYGATPLQLARGAPLKGWLMCALYPWGQGFGAAQRARVPRTGWVGGCRWQAGHRRGDVCWGLSLTCLCTWTGAGVHLCGVHAPATP
jgi:hypothetical protein